MAYLRPEILRLLLAVAASAAAGAGCIIASEDDDGNASGYTIGYVPPDRDGAFHRVRVTVQGPGAKDLNIRTRPGYFATGPPR